MPDQSITVTPQRYADGLQQVQTAADNANQYPQSVRAANWHFVVTGRNSADVEEALDPVPMRAFALNVAAWAWAERGVRHPLGDDFTGAQVILPQSSDEQTVLADPAAIPLSLAKQVVLTGTPDDVIANLRCGVTNAFADRSCATFSGVQTDLSRGPAPSTPIRILRAIRSL